MQRALWFQSSLGLDTSADPAREVYNPETGVVTAAKALNVDASKNGRLSRRKGWKLTDVTDNAHSLFCDGGVVLCVSGNALILASPDFKSVTNLRNVSVGVPMVYTQVGSRVFYSNGVEQGIVLNNKSYSWDGPTVDPKDSTEAYSAPPVGSLLSYHKGRMYVISQYVSWFSIANNINTFNLKEYLAFPTDITMWRGVKSGIWVSTKSQIVFLRGDSPVDCEHQRKALVGAIPGSDCYVDCTSVIGLKDNFGYQISGVGVIFTTVKGIYLGTEAGELIQISRGKVEIPAALRGAGVCSDGVYICSLSDSLFTSCLTIRQELITSATTQYTNFNFNSYAVTADGVFGAGSGGIYKLNVADNDIVDDVTTYTIDAKYKTVLTDFGQRVEKKVRKCNASVECNGELLFTFSANETNEISQEKIPALTDNKQHSVEIPVGLEIRGRYVDFMVENVSGADFSLDNLEVFFEVLSRKPARRGSN